jgi:hypothetical protein
MTDINQRLDRLEAMLTGGFKTIDIRLAAIETDIRGVKIDLSTSLHSLRPDILNAVTPSILLGTQQQHQTSSSSSNHNSNSSSTKSIKIANKSAPAAVRTPKKYKSSPTSKKITYTKPAPNVLQPVADTTSFTAATEAFRVDCIKQHIDYWNKKIADENM